MMDSSSVLKVTLVSLRREMKGRGFSGKGTTFSRQTEAGNTLVFALQKSVKSTATEALLTINYGVYSARVGNRLQEDPSYAFDVMRAHWRKRLSVGGQERWLHVRASDSSDDATSSLLAAIEEVIADLRDHATDEALRDEWLSGSSPGQGSMQRLLFAAILVNEIGPVEKLNEVVGELRGLVADGVHQALVENRLARAGIRGA